MQQPFDEPAQQAASTVPEEQGPREIDQPADANPYSAPLVDSSVIDPDGNVELPDNTRQDSPAATGSAPKPHPPRVWTVFLIALASWASFMLVSMVMLVVAFYVVHGEFSPRLMVSGDAMKSVSADRLGLVLLVSVPQLGLVLPTLLAAFLSPERMDKRLSLVRGHWPLWAWIAAGLTTPLIGWISSAIVGSLMEESDNLRFMSEIFRSHGETGFLIPLAILIGATPAFCEEFLFRGYMQTRLNHRFGPAIGILLSSIAFAAFHMDLIHIIAVFPLGLYLGIIAWRSGSLIPAMLGHCVNNSISVFAVVLGPESMDQKPSPEMALFLVSVLGVGMIGAALTSFAMWRVPMPQQPSIG